MKRTHGLDEKEMELVKLLNAPLSTLVIRKDILSAKTPQPRSATFLTEFLSNGSTTPLS